VGLQLARHRLGLLLVMLCQTSRQFDLVGQHGASLDCFGFIVARLQTE
jgi:hypothetical protein